MSKLMEAVLNAADDWCAALEALMKAKEASGGTESEQELVDCAGVKLVTAVRQWRLTRDRSMPEAAC